MLSFLNYTYLLLMYVIGYGENPGNNIQNKCITITAIGRNNECNWMSKYCYENLGKNNYFFTDNVCKYEPKTGFYRHYEFNLEDKYRYKTNGAYYPIAGNNYTCCTF